MKNIKTVLSLIWLNYETLSAFEISFKFNLCCNLNVSKEGWLSALVALDLTAE